MESSEAKTFIQLASESPRSESTLNDTLGQARGPEHSYARLWESKRWLRMEGLEQLSSIIELMIRFISRKRPICKGLPNRIASCKMDGETGQAIILDFPEFPTLSPFELVIGTAPTYHSIEWEFGAPSQQDYAVPPYSTTKITCVSLC